jgi:hypothetical protein
MSLTRFWLRLYHYNFHISYLEPKQKGFIREKFILDNVEIVWEGMECARYLRLKALFITLDFEKMYGHVERPFISPMLWALNFG